jgi:hypothetical protein
MERIRQDLGYDEALDERAATWLNERLEDSGSREAIDAAGRILHAADVTVVGAADSARGELEAGGRPTVLVSAGGATTAAREVGWPPQVVVTDLDGAVDDQVWAAERGSLVFVHAHGDNLEAMARWLPRFPQRRLVGTCQVRAFGELLNPGGFTDGDRACFLVHAFGARSIRLAGFDFEGGVGRYSGGADAEATRRKLAWGRRLLGLLHDEGAPLESPAGPEHSSSTHST